MAARTRQPARRLLVAVVVVLCGALAVVAGVAVLVGVLVSPAAAPVAIVATVLGPAAAAFGSGEDGQLTGAQLAEAADGSGLQCDNAPEVDRAPLRTGTPEDPPVAVPGETSGSGTTPIQLGEGGSISRADAEMLLAPLGESSSTLRAHVWFLYRLSGAGNWMQFAKAYEDSGLAADEESDNAPLRQVQQINTVGADVERYRLTAAALAGAGQLTGRLTDPYPDYRQLVAAELIGSCVSDSGEERMVLPPPATSMAPSDPRSTPTR